MQKFARVSSAVVISATAMSLLILCGQASAQVHPTASTLDCGDVGDCEHRTGLPFFDARMLPSEVPSRKTGEALEAAKTSVAWARREARLRALMAEIPQLRCDEHHLFGTPHFLRSTARFLTGPSVLAPRQVVEQYISANSDLFEITGKDLESARVVRDFDTHGIMHHLTYQQTIDGLDLYGNILRTSVTARGELIHVSSAFIPTPDAGWLIPQVSLTGLEALEAAAQDAGITITTTPEPGQGIGNDEKTVWMVGPEFDTWIPVSTRKVLFAMTRDDIRPAYVAIVPTRGAGHTYETVIDATTGGVLWRQNYLAWETTQPVTYRYYTSDSPAPGSPGPASNNGQQFPFVLRDLVTFTPAMISAQSPNGWIPDGGTQTVGNNVDAYQDAANDSTMDPSERATQSASRTFDFAMAVDGTNKPSGEPATYRDAAITNAFVLVNQYHDRLRAMGFNEAAGNFQLNNFGLGGLGNDYVRMEVQDGGGTNNANFSTPADGSPPRCQMYRWTGPAPDRDGAFDAEIVAHELTHGTSNRCHEITLTGTQARGMGEGWGDFYGVCLNAKPGDDFAGNYTTGAHSTYQLWESGLYDDNYYFGIRRFPYSIDENKNPQTYADVDSPQEAYPPSVPRNANVVNDHTSVHNKGEVWCNALLECRYFISLDSGFAANQTMMQLVLDGMKLAPGNPTMLQERDAIILSDMVRYAGANSGRLWQGFADSGMGWSAFSPTGGATLGIIEAFNAPAGCDGDVNCDFALDGFDVEVQEKAVGGDMTDYCRADPDFNGDFALDGFDVEAVEVVVGGGPCP